MSHPHNKRLTFDMEPITGEYVLQAIEGTAFVMRRLTTGKTFRVSHAMIARVGAYVEKHGFTNARTNGSEGISKTTGIEHTVAHALNLKRVERTWEPA